MLNLEAVGSESAPVMRSWDERDAMLYALGVGAGSLDAHEFELEYTTENSDGRTLRVLPTFATIIGRNAFKLSGLGEIDFTKVVHGDQSITVYGPISSEGTLEVRSTVDGIYDKGSGALIALSSTGIDPATGAVALTTRMGIFVRGAGGFDGPRGPEPDAEDSLAAMPRVSSRPDHVVSYPTRPDQALLYRLSGDRNPLHSDPVFARRASFDRPILHGLCTYGFTGRALLHGVCGSQAARFGSMRARFARPTYPGDTLTVSIWNVSDELAGAFRFQTENQRSEVVIDAGVFRLADAPNG
jgi:acyl dehydratase